MIVHVSLNIYFYYQNCLFNNFMEQINILIDHIKVFHLYKNSSKCTGCTLKSTYTDVSQSDGFLSFRNLSRKLLSQRSYLFLNNFTLT